jgi:hypothetical protein
MKSSLMKLNHVSTFSGEGQGVTNRPSKGRQTLFSEGTVSAMNLLFRTPGKSEDLISIYSQGIHDFNPQPKMLSFSDDL